MEGQTTMQQSAPLKRTRDDIDAASLLVGGMRQGSSSKKRPLVTDTTAGEVCATISQTAATDTCSSERRPLKKRWSALATSDSTTTAAPALVAISAPINKAEYFNPLALLSEASATADLMEQKPKKKGLTIAEAEAAEAVEAEFRVAQKRMTSQSRLLTHVFSSSKSPASTMLKNQLMRRRLMLAGVQDQTGGGTQAAWQRNTRGHTAPAGMILKPDAAPVATKTITSMVDQATAHEAAIEARLTASIEARFTAAPGVKTLTTEVNVAPVTATKECLTEVAAATNLAPASMATPKETKTAVSKKTAKAVAKPVREYNYTPLGGRHYCWM